MTRYLINSGGAKHVPELKRQFHQAMVQGLGTSPHILLCNFAQLREVWEMKFDQYAANVREDMSPGITPTFELAMPDLFTSQCASADVIYIHGGDDDLVQYRLSKFDLSKLCKDKVVATSSASSDAIVAHYWTCDWRQCGDGFGIIPIKFIPHYMSEFGSNDPRGPIDWQKAYDELAAYGDTSLPIHALKEGEYIVVEKDT